jgi:hypothetical protein
VPVPDELRKRILDLEGKGELKKEVGIFGEGIS